jgi:hypothetical protein
MVFEFTREGCPFTLLQSHHHQPLPTNRPVEQLKEVGRCLIRLLIPSLTKLYHTPATLLSRAHDQESTILACRGSYSTQNWHQHVKIHDAAVMNVSSRLLAAAMVASVSSLA